MADAESVVANITDQQHAAEVEVALAGLTAAEHEQVVAALHDDGPITTSEAFHEIDEARQAADHRAEAAAVQHEQAQAADRGDYAAAHDHAAEVAYELQVAGDHGAEVGMQVVNAAHDTASLDNASWQQDIAHDDAVAAQSYADAGHHDTASMYADHAADHASVAADYGHAGDAGGSYASHDASSDASASHVDTSSATE